MATKRIIKSVLRKKVDSWLDSIDDESVKKIVADNVIITGGSIVNLLINEKVKDYDVYFKTKEAVVAIAKYYIAKYKEIKPGAIISLAYDSDSYDKLNSQRVEDSLKAFSPDMDRVRIFIKSRGVEGELPEEANEDAIEGLTEEQKKEDDKKKYQPIFFSSNAITLSGKIQLIIRFFGEPEEIHKNYDFVHCTNYWTSWDNALVLRPEAIEAILTKQLLYIGSKYPVCSVIRTKKFVLRGWSCNAGQYLKMIFQCGELDLKDPAVLEDQLVGVDSAYFDMLISALLDHKDKHPEFQVSYGYLAELIDRIF
jgi:hypothetical protein